jgi:hypothetical protein
MNQEMRLHLIVLNQQGKPQLILEPRQQAHPSSGEQSLGGTALSEQNDGASSFGGIIHRQPQHVDGTTLSQIITKAT